MRKKWIAKSNSVLVLITFYLFLLLFYLAQKIYVKTPGFKASKFQVHNKYRAPLDKCSPYIN